MCPEIKTSELTERQQLRRLRAGLICFAVGPLICALGFAVAVFVAGATQAAPATLGKIAITGLGLGILTVIAGVYPYLRGLGFTKRRCRRLIAKSFGLAAVVLLLVLFVGWLHTL